MPTTTRKALSPRPYAAKYLGILFVLNLISALDGRGRTQILYVDALAVALFVLGLIATRIWPDKIWLRRDPSSPIEAPSPPTLDKSPPFLDE
jgi:hypothetical protein